MSSSTLRAFFAVAAVAVLVAVHGVAAAVPIQATEERANVLTIENWPAAQWVEPSSFVAGGFSGLFELPPIEEGIRWELADPTPGPVRWLTLMNKLAGKTHGVLGEAEAGLPPDPGVLRLERPIARAAAIRDAGHDAVTWHPNASSWDSPQITTAALPALRIYGDTALQAAAPAAGQAPVQRQQNTGDMLPMAGNQDGLWIALTLVALGWIGWRWSVKN